jgi:hypothetical protein
MRHNIGMYGRSLLLSFIMNLFYFIFVFETLQNLNDWNELDLEINFESNITLIMHGTHYKL